MEYQIHFWARFVKNISELCPFVEFCIFPTSEILSRTLISGILLVYDVLLSVVMVALPCISLVTIMPFYPLFLIF